MDFSAIALTVARLIKANGRDIYLQRLDGAAADYDKPWRGAGTPTLANSVPVRGSFIPATGDALGTSFVPIDLLARCDEVLIVAAGETDFTDFQVVLDHGLRWKIEWTHVLQPADVRLLYAFGVRR